MPMTEDELSDLEDLVDRVGMPEIIGSLAEIAWAKEEHVASAWQDKQLARDWSRVAKALDKFQAKLEPTYPG